MLHSRWRRGRSSFLLSEMWPTRRSTCLGCLTSGLVARFEVDRAPYLLISRSIAFAACQHIS
jgi:hypothetical protein